MPLRSLWELFFITFGILWAPEAHNLGSFGHLKLIMCIPGNDFYRCWATLGTLSAPEPHHLVPSGHLKLSMWGILTSRLAFISIWGEGSQTIMQSASSWPPRDIFGLRLGGCPFGLHLAGWLAGWLGCLAGWLPGRLAGYRNVSARQVFANHHEKYLQLAS